MGCTYTDLFMLVFLLAVIFIGLGCPVEDGKNLLHLAHTVSNQISYQDTSVHIVRHRAKQLANFSTLLSSIPPAGLSLSRSGAESLSERVDRCG